MRITASIGVLVATGLFGHSASQATDYGNPGGGPVSNPVDGSGTNVPGSTDEVPSSLLYPSTAGGSVPGTLPNDAGPVSGDGSSDLPPSIPGGVPGNSPDNESPNGPGVGSMIIPGNFPTKNPQNVPGSPDSGASVFPTCPFRSTTTATVVVTIYPTGNQDGSGFPWPDDSDSGETYTPTPLPAKPAEITSLTPESVVSPFTTLTLDIWGPDGSPSGPDTGGNGDNNSPDGNNSPADGSGNGNNDSNGQSGPGAGDNGSQTNPDTPLFSSTPGPNGAPEYSGSDSSDILPGVPAANTPVPQSTPFQKPGFPGNGIASGNQPQIPSSGPAQEASGSLPVTTQAGPQGQGENSPGFTYVPDGSDASQPSPSSITIAGKDGLPTVISGGGSIVPSQGQLPTTSGFPQNSASTGSPGEVLSGLPFASSVPAVFPGSHEPFNSQTSPLPAGESAAGITTCATLTITGANGLPTVVDSTWVVPINTPASTGSSQLTVTADPQAILSGIPFDANSYTAAPVPSLHLPQDGPSGPAIDTCTSYNVVGSDGFSTLVHSTWDIPVATPSFPGPVGASEAVSSGDLLSVTGLSTFNPSHLADSSNTASNINNNFPITTCSSYTVIGTDGLLTVVDSTWVIPQPADTDVTISIGLTDPSQATGVLPGGATSGAEFQTTALPSTGQHDGNESGNLGGDGITTCISLTITGPNGLPTIVDSTLVVPGPSGAQPEENGNPSFVSDSLPFGLPTGDFGPVTTSAEVLSEHGQGNMPGFTTCITYTVLGTDGFPTVTDSTLVIPTGDKTPAVMSTLPSILSGGQIGSPLGVPGASTIITTAAILGPDGKPTPTVQTVILSDSSALGVSADVSQIIVSGITSPAVPGPVLSTGNFNTLSTGSPNLNGYDDGIPVGSMSVVLTDASAEAQGASITGTTTGTLTWTVTSVTDASGNPVVSDGNAQSSLGLSGDDISDQLSRTAYGPVPSDNTLWPLSTGPSNVQTSTWTNIIKADTTSYTIDYPLTTLATIAVPGKRLFRRQEMIAWFNSTTSAPSMTSSSPTTTASKISSPSICATGGSIGNTTVDFDSSKPGPLFNPVENIWFSGGFLIAPPNSNQPQPYIPSSGGQLVEFVPPALSNTTSTISGDVAQIGVGPHAASPCFRFDFFGANFGCDARGNEKWCEFEISAYRWNATSSTEESIAWSETKQVPACPTFSNGGYELTRVDLDGYTDLSSVLITVRVSSDLRVWWGDDFRVGWTENSCIAASCRTNTPSQMTKRETILSALRQGVYQWTPYELKRLEDSLV
ncbi:hypothetical protein FHETE_1824 [Fusarium heterosporum]|uniref:DUF7371 domain-containing protein n=1 Tax=Fusarium heterosporum TaxID=42747 RepID=A0A8H5WVN6_FUSHE|nr:hypothetical protein FHETE_1824 [Fusarium heterosporum]